MKAILKKELPKAQEQLTRYIEAVYAEEGRVKTGIVTDGLEFKAFRPVIKHGRVIDLKDIESKNIVIDNVYEFVS